jgi:uncharacterized protein YceK
MTRVALILLAIGLALLSGCGTFADSMAGPADDHLYYRGVRLDIAAVKKGVAIMAFDLPFSACADTILVPSIAFHQLTDPPGTKFKSALDVASEEIANKMTTEVMVPMATEMAKAAAQSQESNSAPPPETSPKVLNR